MARTGCRRVVLISVLLSSVPATSLLPQVGFRIQRDCALLPSADDWDRGGFDTMEVRYRDGLFQMWYGASDSGNFRNGQQIGYAWSEDGCTWTRHELNPVLTNLLGWESAGIYSPTVIRDSDGYKMWFKGMVSTEECDIGFATSEDPVSWERYSDRPVLSPESRGAATACAFDPYVHYDGSTYHMWYSQWSGGEEDIRYATSSDGVHWNKYAGNPVIRHTNGATSPTVVYDETTESYEMWYSTPFSGQLSYRTSIDGRHWSATPRSVSLAGGGAPRVSNPTVVLVDGTYHLWYNTSGGGVWYEDIRYGTAEWSQPKASFRIEGDLAEDGETGTAPLTITVDASRSATPDEGGITSYLWDFGDGTEAEGRRAQHTYPLGEHTVTLEIVDAKRRRSSGARTVRAVYRSEPVDPWTATDVGAAGFPGGSRLDGECLAVAEARGDIGGREDKHHFVHQRVDGDFRLEAKITTWNGTSTSELGLSVRESLESGARAVALTLRSGKVYLLARREVGGAAKSDRRDEYGELPLRLRIERRGDLIIARYVLGEGGEGATWIGTDPVLFEEPLPAAMYVGVAAAGRQLELAEATVCELEIGAPQETLFRRGESNGDGRLDLSDAIFTLTHLFAGGEAPSCLKSADTIDDGRLDLADAVFLFAHLFSSGPPPVAPSAICGFDTTPDELTCESFESCP